MIFNHYFFYFFTGQISEFIYCARIVETFKKQKNQYLFYFQSFIFSAFFCLFWKSRKFLSTLTNSVLQFRFDGFEKKKKSGRKCFSFHFRRKISKFDSFVIID